MKNINKFTIIIFLVLAFVSFTTLVSATDARDIPFTREVLMHQDPDPAEPGETVELRWKVAKEGTDPIKNLTYKLKPEYPFSLHPSFDQVKNVGWWRSTGEDYHYTLYYELMVDEDADEKTHTVELLKRYEDNHSWRTKEYDIRVGEKEKVNLQRGNIRSDPKQLKSDIEDIELDIEIQNIGKKDAENVKMTLAPPEGFGASYTHSQETFLGRIPAGESKTGSLYFDIDEDLASGFYGTNLTLHYKESNEDEYKEKHFPVDLLLKAKPEFDILSAEPGEFNAGDKGELSLRIKNTGDKKAESITVNAFKDVTQPFDFQEKSDFIGTLDPGEEGEAVLTFDIDPDAQTKKHIIELEIRGIDGDEVIVEQKQTRIKINEREKIDLTHEHIIGIIAVIAAIILISLGIYLLTRSK
ncbi:MAG: COG1361 S-layer family protein [Nanoarchaeota archaeon]